MSNIQDIEIPFEVWEHIFSFVTSTRDLKSLSLVNKQFYAGVKPVLWRTPALKAFNVNDFLHLHKMPIRELSTENFHYSDELQDMEQSIKMFQLIAKMTALTSLELTSSELFYYTEMLMELAVLVNLRALTITSVIFHAESVSQLLPHFKKLEELFITSDDFYCYTSADDAQLSEAVARVAGLRKLTLPAISVEFCKHLSKLDKLELRIIVPQSMDVVKALDELNVLLPKCEMIYEEERESDNDDYHYHDDDYHHRDDDRYSSEEEFTPYSGYYRTGNGDRVYRFQGECADYTACDKECGYCGMCDY